MRVSRWGRGFSIFLCIIFVLVLAIGALFFYEIKTLCTLNTVDSYPFYTMTYSGDYGFDEFLTVGAQSDSDIEKFIMKRLLKGLEIDLNITSGGCTAFTKENINGEQIYGRNFDFAYAPPLLLRTNPDDGYASVSMVNLAYAGYDEDYLPQKYNFNSFLTLAAPYLPFDGMNEMGVTIALLAVPYAEPPQKENQITLNTTTAIRLVLDYADSVDSAIELLGKYNYYFSGDVECHYLIADASGNSVIVEFLEGEMKVTEATGDYQIASNFITYNDMNIGDGGNVFERYDTVDMYLCDESTALTDDMAMEILSTVRISEYTQWSVVYNMQSKGMKVCIDEDYSNCYEFNLNE